MGIRQNIFISIMIHIMIIASVFIIGGRVRDRTSPVKIDFMVVALLEKLSEDTPTHPSPLEGEGKGEGITRTGIAENITPEDSKKSTTIWYSPYTGISVETYMSHTTTKDNESKPPESPHTPFWKRDNPPCPTFLKGGKEGLFIKGGLEGDFKGGKGELPEQNTAAQNTGKNQLGNRILEGFEGIRAAIEKAKDYPFLARKKKIEGTVITEFNINSTGYPEDIRVERGSGSELLDSAAIKIVKRAAPFPRVNGKIVVPITFKLTDSTSSH
ncbi:MAG: energy transducer TonB [Nitrospira sp.]|nr:energy transducer TonB [Nitrospira sp.]